MSININCSNNKLHITLYSYSMNPSGKIRYIQINLSRSCGHASLMKNVNRLGSQGDLNTYQFLACVAWRFWLGALSNKGGRGQRNREEIGAAATQTNQFPKILPYIQLTDDLVKPVNSQELQVIMSNNK